MAFLTRHPFASTLLIALAGWALAACGDDTGSGGSGGEGTGGAGGEGTGGVGTEGPINAPPGTWTWVPFAGTQCMDGSETGIAVNLSDTSKDVFIFLEGGNACFNFASCAVTANKDGYDADKFAAQGADDVGAYPYLDRTDAANPLKDMSMIYVPYCTGDLHFGSASDVEVANEMRQFHGYDNMSAFLERIVATFPEAENVVLGGISAGGFGAALNYDHVASAFGDGVNTVLIDDCGPPMADPFVPQCLQEHFATTWGFADTLPSDCAGCTGAFVEPYVDYLLTKYPDRSLGLISSAEDETITGLLGFGEMDCQNLMLNPLPYDPAQYTAGLEDLRDRVAAGSNGFRLFLIPGNEHVFLNNAIGSVTQDGVALEDWIAAALTGGAGWEHVPAP